MKSFEFQFLEESSLLLLEVEMTQGDVAVYERSSNPPEQQYPDDGK